MISNIINPIKSMKISDYISIQSEEYSVLQLIPTKSNRNTSSDQIAKMVNKMYKQTNQLIKRENQKIIIHQQMKLSFHIHMTSETIQFYFLVPKVQLNKFKVKFKEIWRNIEIKEVETLPTDINSCSKAQMVCQYEDVLSLNTNKSNNDLFNSNFSILSDLQEGEEVGIIYNFIPTSERQSNYFFKKAIDKKEEYIKGYNNLKKNKTKGDYAVISLKYIISFMNDLIYNLLNRDNKSTNTNILLNKELSPSSNRKLNSAKSEICKSQILLVSKSDTKSREKEIINTLANSYKIIDDDNKLIVKNVTKDIDIKKSKWRGVSVNKTSTDECNNFINMPSLDIIKQFNMIEHNKVLELSPPKELEQGEIRVGIVRNKENRKMIYYSTEPQLKRLSRVIMGSMGAGKDFYMTEFLAKDIIKAGRGLIVIDYIDECQLANGIKKITPKEKLIEINCDNISELQAFLFNEMNYKDDDDIYTKLEVSMQKAQLFEALLDSINGVDSKLTPRMLRYLYCAGTIAIMVNKNASFKNVIDLLKSPTLREELIENISEDMKEVLSEEIEDLKELDNIDKKGNVTNYDSKVEGILDRIVKLKSSNLFTKMAYIKDGTNNIDFVKAMNEKKVVLIKIPHKRFKDQMLKDLMCTFFLSKIWLAKQESDKSIQTEVFLNEIHQSPHSQLLLENIMVEHRKQNITFTFALHYMDQLTKKCQKSIMSAGASFMLCSGCDPEAYNGLATYFKKDGYTETDVAELDRFNALCLIKNENNYSSFVVDNDMRKEENIRINKEIEDGKIL